MRMPILLFPLSMTNGPRVQDFLHPRSWLHVAALNTAVTVSSCEHARRRPFVSALHRIDFLVENDATLRLLPSALLPASPLCFTRIPAQPTAQVASSRVPLRLGPDPGRDRPRPTAPAEPNQPEPTPRTPGAASSKPRCRPQEPTPETVSFLR